MPNTPAAVGEGMIPYCANDAVTAEETAEFCRILHCAGRLDPLPERLIDAAGALSGCGPAFVYVFLEALADAAVACGLPRAKATPVSYTHLHHCRRTRAGSRRLPRRGGRCRSLGLPPFAGIGKLSKGGSRK